MKKTALLICLMLFLSPAAFAKDEETYLPDTSYDLLSLVSHGENEEVMLALPVSYYSGEPVYKGNTGVPLSGACALHSASVVISNLLSTEITGQEITAANNRDIREPRRWVNYVSWGKLASRYQVEVSSVNMVQYDAVLRNSGMHKADRRQNKMETLAEALTAYGEGAGIILHFNSSGQLNGSGHRHVVVLLGYILENHTVTDLLISDSAVKAPAGACVRLSESSLPLSMLGKKALTKAVERGDHLTQLMMDYVVSYRYITKAGAE